jgi:hypothetical protein
MSNQQPQAGGLAPDSEPLRAQGEAQADPNTGTTSNELSVDEQMALFEQALKESDWGHQPC